MTESTSTTTTEAKRTIDRAMPPARRVIASAAPGRASVETTGHVGMPLAVTMPVRTERATLTLLSGRAAGATFPLMRSRPTLIGRGEDADVILEDSAISRHHAHIFRAPSGHYMIEDLRSVNGTFVNAQRIQRVILSTGFRVQLGPDCILRFAVADVPAEASLRRAP